MLDCRFSIVVAMNSLYVPSILLDMLPMIAADSTVVDASSET